MEEAITFACQECGKGAHISRRSWRARGNVSPLRQLRGRAPGERSRAGFGVANRRESRTAEWPPIANSRTLGSALDRGLRGLVSSRIFQQCMPPYPHCFAQVRRATIFSVIQLYHIVRAVEVSAPVLVIMALSRRPLVLVWHRPSPVDHGFHSRLCDLVRRSHGVSDGRLAAAAVAVGKVGRPALTHITPGRAEFPAISCCWLPVLRAALPKNW